MEKILLIAKRKRAKYLYTKKKWSIRKIAKYLSAGRSSVSRWVKMDEDGIKSDNRGWQKGRLRKYKQEDKEAIISIREELVKEESYFWGDIAIKSNFLNQTSKEASLWFINSTLREKGLTKKHVKRQKGGSKYMMYPIRTINKLGSSMMSLDFIGPKYLEGSSDKINFLSCKYIRPTKEGIVKRIGGQTTEQTIQTLKEIWETYYIPDTLKVDNDSAFGGNLTHKKCIGRLTLFLLNLGVKPLYIAPRSPWNNGEVEGFNNVFSKKFWNRISFDNEEEIDIKIKDFNFEYERYSKLISNNPPLEKKRKISDFKNQDLANKQVKKFRTKDIYFLRIVRRKGNKNGKNEKGVINILGEEITLKKDLINLFVFCQLSLERKKIFISTESDGKLQRVKEKVFEIKNIVY
ncbi:MAG TPA: transposase [Flavobacteriia bacterium]|nr:transposase [Flavobacteriia bacterium]